MTADPTETEASPDGPSAPDEGDLLDRGMALAERTVYPLIALLLLGLGLVALFLATAGFLVRRKEREPTERDG